MANMFEKILSKTTSSGAEILKAGVRGVQQAIGAPPIGGSVAPELPGQTETTANTKPFETTTNNRSELSVDKSPDAQKIIKKYGKKINKGDVYSMINALSDGFTEDLDKLENKVIAVSEHIYQQIKKVAVYTENIKKDVTVISKKQKQFDEDLGKLKYRIENELIKKKSTSLIKNDNDANRNIEPNQQDKNNNSLINDAVKAYSGYKAVKTVKDVSTLSKLGGLGVKGALGVAAGTALSAYSASESDKALRNRDPLKGNWEGGLDSRNANRMMSVAGWAASGAGVGAMLGGIGTAPVAGIGAGPGAALGAAVGGGIGLASSTWNDYLGSGKTFSEYFLSMNKDKQNIVHQDNIKKYGEEKADELAKSHWTRTWERITGSKKENEAEKIVNNNSFENTTDNYELKKSSISLEAKLSDIEFLALRNIKAKAQGTITLDAPNIVLDSPNITFTSKPRILKDLDEKGDSQKTSSPKMNERQRQQYNEDVEKHGVDKADQLADVRMNPMMGSARSLWGQITGQSPEQQAQAAGEAIGTRNTGGNSTTASTQTSSPTGDTIISGDRTGLDKNSKLIDYNSTHMKKELGINDSQWNAYRQGLAKIESGGKYGLIGGSSNKYSGAYQFGPNEISSTAKRLGESAPSRQQYLQDPQMQERYLDRYTKYHHDYLIKNSNAYRNLNSEDKLKVLGYAHNQGEGGARKWLETGQVGRDAFGTAGTAYSKEIGNRLGALSRQSSSQTATKESVVPGQGDTKFVGKGTMGTNDRLHAAVVGGSGYLPEGYTLKQTSGARDGHNQSHHKGGNAGDFQIYDPNGKPIPNRGEDTTGMYTLLARGVKTWVSKNDPELMTKIGYGGAFGTKLGGGGVPDLMHFDLGGSRGRMRPEVQFHKLSLINDEENSTRNKPVAKSKQSDLDIPAEPPTKDAVKLTDPEQKIAQQFPPVQDLSIDGFKTEEKKATLGSVADQVSAESAFRKQRDASLVPPDTKPSQIADQIIIHPEDMENAIPKPKDEDIPKQPTSESIKETLSKDDQKERPSQGSPSITPPVHNPEQAMPGARDNGYGRKRNNDNVGFCSI